MATVADESKFATKEDLAELGKQIASGITTGMTAMTRPKVTIGQYQAAHRRKVKLAFAEAYQNNKPIDINVLTDGEVEWLNKVHRPGRYIERRVEVIVNDQDPSARILYIRYSDRTPDQRMENARFWKSFTELCQKIVVEQDVIEENEAELKADQAAYRAHLKEVKEKAA